MPPKLRNKQTHFVQPDLLTFGIENYDRLKRLAKDMKLTMPDSGDFSHELLLQKVLECYRKFQLTSVHALYWQHTRDVADYADTKVMSVAKIRKDIVIFVMDFIRSKHHVNDLKPESKTSSKQNIW